MKIPSSAACLLLCACSGGAGGPAEPGLPAVEFDGARAFADLKHLVEQIGPRRIGTPQSAETRVYIRQQLEGRGWQWEEDAFRCSPPEGARRKGEITGTNLIARRPGTEEGEIWIAGHYDTFDLPGFVGANDGGSSTAVLIELGRQLGAPEPYEGPAIVLCWFDGEEPFSPVAWNDADNSTFGSRHLAARLQESGDLARLKALVLLDMVGDKDLRLIIESMSTAWLADVFRRTARSLRESHIFAPGRAIRDDHMPFVRAGTPAIDLIDFHFGTLNEYWHTRQDTADKCSPESLGRVGTLVLSALPAIAAHSGR